MDDIVKRALSIVKKTRKEQNEKQKRFERENEEWGIRQKKKRTNL